jgi:hypothetical protein
MTKSIVSISAIAVALLAGVSPATAAVKTATYSGTVDQGLDTTGVFGPANTSLAGASYIATFTYDRTLGSSNTIGTSAGGSLFGTTSPIIAASLRINNITWIIPAGADDFVRTSVSPEVWHYVSSRKIVGAGTQRDQVNYRGFPVTAPESLDQNVAPVPAVGGGSFTILTMNNFNNAFMVFAQGSFSNDAIYSVGDVASIPEPASWAMLIAGFGLTGAAMRRRRILLAA